MTDTTESPEGGVEPRRLVVDQLVVDELPIDNIVRIGDCVAPRSVEEAILEGLVTRFGDLTSR